MKKILAFLLIALLISGCESNSGNKSIDEGDVFVVGMECNYPPFNWQTNTQSDTAVELKAVVTLMAMMFISQRK